MITVENCDTIDEGNVSLQSQHVIDHTETVLPAVKPYDGHCRGMEPMDGEVRDPQSPKEQTTEMEPSDGEETG